MHFIALNACKTLTPSSNQLGLALISELQLCQVTPSELLEESAEAR